MDGRSFLALRLALAAFVLAWLFGPFALRTAVPAWLVLAIAIGLEVHFFAGAFREQPSRRPDRGPQLSDRERWGYEREPDELLLVREEGEDLWIPYSGETDEELDELIAETRRREEEAAAAPPAPVARARFWTLRRILAAGALVATLALTIWFVDARTGWNGLGDDRKAEAAARFSDEASRIAGKSVAIGCDESGAFVGAVQHADGVAIVGGDAAWLTPERCFDLYRLAFRDEVHGAQTARAVAVLAHEAWHLRGVRDEGTTECYALQSGVELGRRLGLSESTARRLMRQQLVENSLRGASTAEYLVPPDCRDGGRLDLRPDDERFP
jgi:hypothetical protein